MTIVDISRMAGTQSVDLTPARQWYLRFTSQETLRLTNLILEVQERQRQKAALILESESDQCAYLIRLLQFDEEEYRFLVAQQEALRNSIRSTISSWTVSAKS